MANPKRRTSKSKKRARRAAQALEPHQLVRCSNCGSRIRPHTVCGTCGHYRGRQILHVAD